MCFTTKVRDKNDAKESHNKEAKSQRRRTNNNNNN